MDSRNNRLQWVDSMKAFSIMAVVLNHTHIMPEIRTAVYLVCLPAFFFSAGLFASTRLSPGEFFVNKTLRLLIPFLFWGAVSWLAWLLIGRHYGADAGTDLEWWRPLWGMLCGNTKMMPHNPPLWFLCCLMCLEWLHYGISRIPRKRLRWLIIFFLALLGCILSLDGRAWPLDVSAAFIVLPLYAFASENATLVKEKARTASALVLLLALIVSLAGVGTGYLFNGDVALAETRIGNPVIYYITILSVVVMWFSVSLLLERTGAPLRGLQYIGQNTLLVLCTHMPVFGMIKGIGLVCRIPLEFFETTAGCLCLWVGAFVLILPATFFFNRFCPVLVGKRRSANP